MDVGGGGGGRGPGGGASDYTEGFLGSNPAALVEYILREMGSGPDDMGLGGDFLRTRFAPTIAKLIDYQGLANPGGNHLGRMTEYARELGGLGRRQGGGLFERILGDTNAALGSGLIDRMSAPEAMRQYGELLDLRGTVMNPLAGRAMQSDFERTNRRYLANQGEFDGAPRTQDPFARYMRGTDFGRYWGLGQ